MAGIVVVVVVSWGFQFCHQLAICVQVEIIGEKTDGLEVFGEALIDCGIVFDVLELLEVLGGRCVRLAIIVDRISGVFRHFVVVMRHV